MQAHLDAHLRLGFGEKVCGAHPGLDGAERMFNRLPSNPHRLWSALQPLLHGIQYLFMFPSCHASLWAWRTLRFELALPAIRAPISMQIQPFFFARETPNQALPGRTLIFIAARIVNEVSLAKPTFGRGI